MNVLAWLQIAIEIVKLLIKLGFIKEADAEKAVVQLIRDKIDSLA